MGQCIVLLLVMYLLYTGFAIHQQTDRTALIAAIWWHVGVSVAAAAMMVVAVVSFRLISTQRAEKGAWSSALSWQRAVLYSLLMLLVISGWLTVWSRGSSLKVFDWFSLPSPVDKLPQLYALMEDTHSALAILLMLISGIIVTIFLMGRKKGRQPKP